MNDWKVYEVQANRSVPMNSGIDNGLEVIVVLSDEFAPSLAGLAAKHQTWALRTVETERVAQEFWKEHPPLDAKAGPGGLTLFTGDGDPETDLLSILDDVELHHGLAASVRPAASALRVLGVEASETVRDALDALGFTRIDLSPGGGFLAHWHRV
jgi:hypothetical protein